MKPTVWTALAACLVLLARPAAAAPYSEERLGAIFDGRAPRPALPSPGLSGPAREVGRGAPPEVPVVDQGALLVPEDPVGRAAALAEAPASQSVKSEPPIDEIPGSDWRAVGKVEDSVSEKDPTAAEKLGFWDKLRNGGFWHDLGDELCKEAEIPLDQPFSFGVVRARPEYDRFLRTGIEGRMVLVDRARLSVGLGYSTSLVDLGGNSPVSVGVSADVSGTSLVVRRLDSARACRELKSLIDLRTLKTVLPLKAARFAAMAVGELWAIPIRFRATFGAGVGTSLTPVPVSVSFGYSREGGTSVTLKRLDEDTLRVRIRVDHAQFYGPSVGVSFRLFGDDFDRYRGEGRDWAGETLGDFVGKEVVWKLVSGQMRRYANRYLSGGAGLSTSGLKEDHTVVEFLLDPHDQAQMQALEALLAGGKLPVLDTLASLSKATGSAFLGLRDARARLKELEKSYSAALEALGGEARSFAGTQSVTGALNSLHIKLPVLWDYSLSSGRRDEQVELLDDSGGRYHIYRSHQESGSAVLDIPFVSSLVRLNKRSSAMALSYEDAQGKSLPPTVVFVQQEGYTMAAEGSARRLALQADRLMRLAGTRGRGEEAARARLPLEKVFPARQPPGAEGEAVAPFYYRRGLGAFTVALGEKAIADILSAPAEDVVRAFARAREGGIDGGALKAAVDKGSVRADGQVDYETPEESRQAVRVNLYYAQKLVAALGEARRKSAGPPGDAAGARRQAEALRDLLHGSVGWGLSYEGLMEVLVQLTDPAHLSAEFIVSASPYDKKAGAVSGRFLYNRGFAEDAGLRRAAEVTARFNRPSEFSD